MTLFGAQLSPSARANNAISHKGNGSEARSSDFSGLRMRDILTVAGDACTLSVAAGDGEVLRAVLRRVLHDGVLLCGHDVLVLALPARQPRYVGGPTGPGPYSHGPGTSYLIHEDQAAGPLHREFAPMAEVTLFGVQLSPSAGAFYTMVFFYVDMMF